MENIFCRTGWGPIMDMMLEAIFNTNIFSTIFLIETRNNSPDLNLKTHAQSALAKGWTKWYKVQRKHPLVHFYTADTDTAVEYKVQDSSSRDDGAGLGKQALSIPARVPHLLAEHSFQSQLFEPHQKYLGFFSFIFSVPCLLRELLQVFYLSPKVYILHEYKKEGIAPCSYMGPFRPLYMILLRSTMSHRISLTNRKVTLLYCLSNAKHNIWMIFLM